MANEQSRDGIKNNDVENERRDEPKSGPAGAPRQQDQSQRRGSQHQGVETGARQQNHNGGNSDDSDLPIKGRSENDARPGADQQR